MNLEAFDESRCQMVEKEIVEGFCLSLDLLRQVCLETGELCLALCPQQGLSSAPTASPAGTLS